MLRALLVALAIAAATLPAVFSFAAADREAPIREAQSLPWSQLQFDDTHLPDETSWFLVPVTVDQPAYVRFATDIFTGSQPADAAWATLLIVEEGGFPPILGAGSGDAAPIASVSHQGERVACCEDLWVSHSYTWGDGPEVTIPMAPGQTAWFGFAAHSWGEWDDAYFEVSGQALITLGDVLTGERVESVDLYADALAQGTRAQLFGSDVVSLPGTSERTWTSEGFGIFTASAWSWGGSAQLSIEMPAAETADVAIGPDSGAFAAAHRAGTYRVALSDVATGGAWPASSGGMWARAFFADISIPGDVAYVHTWPDA